MICRFNTLFFFGIPATSSKSNLINYIPSLGAAGDWETRFYYCGEIIGTAKSSLIDYSPSLGAKGAWKTTFYNVKGETMGTSKSSILGYSSARVGSSGDWLTTFYNTKDEIVGFSTVGARETTFYDASKKTVGSARSRLVEYSSTLGDAGRWETDYSLPILKYKEENTELNSDYRSNYNSYTHPKAPTTNNTRSKLQSRTISFFSSPQTDDNSEETCWSKYNSPATKAVACGISAGTIAGIGSGIVTNAGFGLTTNFLGFVSSLACPISAALSACCVTTTVCCYVCRSDICQCEKDDESGYKPGW
jgi:hypothetical protein